MISNRFSDVWKIYSIDFELSNSKRFGGIGPLVNTNKLSTLVSEMASSNGICFVKTLVSKL